MVFLRHIIDGKTASLLLCLVFGILIAEVVGTKIAYKKSINGKAQAIKLKPSKPKALDTTTTTTSPLSEKVLKAPSSTTSSMLDNLEVAESSHAVKSVKNSEEKPDTAVVKNNETTATEPEQLEPTLDETAATAGGQNTTPTISNSKEIKEIEEAEEAIVELPENDIEAEHVIVDESLPNEHTLDLNETQTTSSEHPTNSTTESTDVHTTTPSKQPTPCTCGIFMTSQIKRSKNPYEPPTGPPVITNELDRTFPCTAVGQKQCQTKCLEAIVQHLPNSANILCATLDRDIRKERAYLYIKNCRNQWYNTNLAAGREYCCKNGQPYQCPLV